MKGNVYINNLNGDYPTVKVIIKVVDVYEDGNLYCEAYEWRENSIRKLDDHNYNTVSDLEDLLDADPDDFHEVTRLISKANRIFNIY